MGELQAYIAQCYRKNGDFPDAFAAIEKALAADPGAIEPRQVNVSLQLAVRNFDRALAEADTLVDLCTKAIPGATRKRDALANLSGAYATRLTVLQKLGEIQFVIGPDGNPTDRVVPGREKTAAEITRRVAETYVLIADLNRTLTYFTTLEFAARAAVIDPTDLEAILLVGMLQRNTYQIEEAASTFRKVLEVDPGNARARAELEAMGVPVAPASQPATKPAPETP
ncbi:MAG: hypothetical protein HZB38_03670 [Planctomycetes bacterium]|nr:hypothetical protein [Planctomycetota bacterium]